MADDSIPRQYDQPLISAVIPAYNSERYLARAINSVLTQTYANIECIVVDDGSTDATASVIASFGNRIKSITQSNAGASAARNAGIAAAQGRYIAFLDSDDYWLNTKTANQIAAFQEVPDLVLVCCGFEWQWPSKSMTSHIPSGPSYRTDRLKVYRDLEPLLRDPYLGTPSVMVYARAIRDVGCFDTSLPIAEDVDMYFRLCANRPYALLDQRLVHFQFRVGSLSKTVSGYQDNLRVLDRLEQSQPELAIKHADIFNARRMDIYRWWVKDLLFRGDGAGAREVLRSNRIARDVDKHRLLYFKSVIAPLTALMRRLRNGTHGRTE